MIVHKFSAALPSKSLLRAALLSAGLSGLISAAALAGAPGEDGTPANHILVQTDYAQTHALDRPVGNIIIGNPAIADVSLRDDSFLFVHGRSPGRTNMIVYDTNGMLIAEYIVRVSSSQEYLTVHRGAESRQHFDCAGRCERVVRMDDDAESAGTGANAVGVSFGLLDTSAARGQAGDAEAPPQVIVEVE